MGNNKVTPRNESKTFLSSKVGKSFLARPASIWGKSPIWVSKMNLLESMEDIVVDVKQLVYVNKHTGNPNSIARDLERSYVLWEAEQQRELLSWCTWIFMLAFVVYTATALSDYVNGAMALDFLFGCLLMRGMFVVIAALAHMFTRSKYYSGNASKVFTYLAFITMAVLVTDSLWLRDATYDLHVGFLLLMFGYMPVQIYSAICIGSLQVTAFVVGHLLLETHTKVAVLRPHTYGMQYGHPSSFVRSRGHLVMRGVLILAFLVTLAYEQYTRTLKARRGHLSKSAARNQVRFTFVSVL
jgi:hypothetical protein